MSLSHDITKDFQRTHHNSELRLEHVGTNIVLNGWVQNRRDHGGIIFIDLRDINGTTQIVFDPHYSNEGKSAHALADSFRGEYVIAIKGTVAKRLEGMANNKLDTGDIEVFVEGVSLLNPSQSLPFQLDEYDQTNEELRLKYRYLDLRRPAMQKNIVMKHEVYKSLRRSLYDVGFMEIETPYLTKSTPEGARDFLVPSRTNQGSFFALPQSPQIFKQLLMSSGYEKYFQFVRCFRDEDLRSDRQPEFTQLDLEMSFVDEDNVMGIAEKIIAGVLKDIRGVDSLGDVPRITYQEAMTKYGNDKPDTRFGMLLQNITEIVKDSGFKVFDSAINNGGVVKGIKAEKADLSRKDIDALTSYVGQFGAKGLAYIRINEDGLQSPITKFLGEKITANIVKHMDAQVGDIIFFAADAIDTVNGYMSRLRLKLGETLGLINESQLNFLWVIDFPLFEYSSEENRYVSVHHPFTAPQKDAAGLVDLDLTTIKSRSYDLVLNGSEIAGGSIRIHTSELQLRVFEMLGIKVDEANEQFGFLLEAMKYGFPPHGGIAFGMDRLVAILCGASSIREVIAFPKTQRATDIMSSAPTEVSVKQLAELGLNAIAKSKPIS